MTKEHTFSLFTKSGQPWATLTLVAHTHRDRATFIEGMACTGEFSLDLDSAASIHTVVVSLRGQIITGPLPSDMFTFLDVSQTLWSKAMGDPLSPGGSKWTKDLKGKYQWPFSLPIQPTVSLSGQEFRLPESFSERHTRAQVEYEVCVKIMRPKLRADHRLSTFVEYLPVSQPSPSSGLRQLAYEHHRALLGPEADPEGWKTLSPVKTFGRLSSQAVEATCTLSLATPLCYTRGTSIPCNLQIESSDPAILDILASPDSVDLRLRRNARFRTRDKEQLWKDQFEFSEMAIWWHSLPSDSLHDSTETLITGGSLRRTLKGELHLRVDLITSSSIAHYQLEYAVVLQLNSFANQMYESLDTGPLIVEPVEIASDLPVGPRPLVYSTPFETKAVTIRPRM
uniref:Arrestin-like N-terminal domain-containing protein n=1 Tax=Mycena chlorophos TaxID=658473 RepID=A0ABQ0L287_MYCCL|nr:predicted protein [Mycena chlorophos]